MLNQFNVSLWGDEAFSAVLSLNPIPKIIEIISRDTAPPLYNVLLHLWYQQFGTGEIAIRSLSFLYFLLTVFFVYKIGSLLFSRKTGLLAAILTFLNPFLFSYGFEGRMYSILALGVTASMYFFLKIIYAKTPNLLIFFGYIISTTWALYSHHFSIFALFVQVLWFLYEFLFVDRKKAGKIFLTFLGIGILYSPWLIPLYNQTKMVGGGFWLGTPTLTTLKNLIYEYLAEGIKNPQIEIPLLDQNLGQISLYFIFAILIIRNWTKNIKKTLFLLSWFLLPILITWGVSQKFTSIFFNRYLLYTIPGAMLVVASNGRKFTGILIGFLLILFGIIDYNYFIHPTKRPFREMASYVKQTQKSGDILINWNSKAHHLWEAKYYEIPAPLYVPEGNLPYYVGTAQMTDSDILRKFPDVQRIGVITSGEISEIKIPDYEEESTKTFGELKFVWYRKIITYF
jgi:mannosyltransferase